MSDSARLAPVRQIEVRIPVPISIIPASALPDAPAVLDEDIAEILAPFADGPGFIGFKAYHTVEIGKVLNGPYAHLLYDNVAPNGAMEIGVYGQIQGSLTHWDRKVYVMGEESGQLEPVFEVPSGAELWVCPHVTRSTCGSLLSAFYTPDPIELLEG